MLLLVKLTASAMRAGRLLGRSSRHLEQVTCVSSSLLAAAHLNVTSAEQDGGVFSQAVMCSGTIRTFLIFLILSVLKPLPFTMLAYGTHVRLSSQFGHDNFVVTIIIDLVCHEIGMLTEV